ncbi:hypothetical protein SAMN02745866_02184 [Alteromonadaceae bacterium Bs31]|nr:hypothetical protein SAMN02745866_02184 [Alteromonadaceae bacterium Bs31]
MNLQQVNLYLPEYRPKKEWISANSLALLVVCTVLMFSLFYVLSLQSISRLEQQVAELENQQLVAGKEVEKLKARAKPFRNNQLAGELRLLRAALKSRMQVEQIIENQNLGNSDGFANSLEALARQSFKSISLHRIKFTDGGRFLQVKGGTKQPEDIAQYIQLLQQEPSFEFTRFGLLSLGKLEKQGVHTFNLGFDSVYSIAMEAETK